MQTLTKSHKQASLKKARIYRVRILMALRAAEQSKGPLRWHQAHLRDTLRTLDYMVSGEDAAHCLMPVHGEGIESTLRGFQYSADKDRIAA
jgi:hypothetical protein